MMANTGTAIKRYRYVLLGAIAAVILGLTASTSTPSHRSDTARPADSFVDMIGVATHLNYRDTAYRNYDTVIKPQLQTLGVRHIRDGFTLEDEASRNKLLDLGTHGIQATLIMDPRWIDTPDKAVAMATATRPALEAVEGPNEWDVWPQVTYADNAFPEGLRQFQAELYQAIKQTAATADLGVLSPAMAHWWNGTKLGRIACDFGTMHSYAGGEMPTGGKLDLGWIPAAKLLCPGKPIIATEAGWHNAVDDERASQPGISERASSHYVPRLYLEYFNRRVQRAYLYELINEWDRADQESNFGLLRYDGSAKPAFTALRNLINLLGDPESAATDFTPDTLTYDLTGDLNRIHHTLLQKGDRRFYLILWQDVPSFDLAQKADLTVSDRPLTLTLATPAAQVNLYRPVISDQPLVHYDKTDRFNLQVPDHPLVIELSSD